MRLIDADQLLNFIKFDERVIAPEEHTAKDIVMMIQTAQTIALPPNDPLALSELREMDFGEWVWIVAINVAPDANITDGYYRKMDGYRPEDAFYFGYPEYEKIGHTAWAQYMEYGKTWLAYRRKPEESNET